MAEESLLLWRMEATLVFAFIQSNGDLEFLNHRDLVCKTLLEPRKASFRNRRWNKKSSPCKYFLCLKNTLFSCNDDVPHDQS